MSVKVGFVMLCDFRSDESSIRNDRNRCEAGIEAANRTAQELRTHTGNSFMLANVIICTNIMLCLALLRTLQVEICLD